jgi:hypothetical protein
VTCTQRFIPLEELEVPAKVACSPLLFTDAEHVRDEDSGATARRDGESEPAISIEPEIFSICRKDGPARVGKNRQYVDRDELIGRHAPDPRLQANDKAEGVERFSLTVDKVIGLALRVLPTEGSKHNFAYTREGPLPAVPPPAQSKSLWMERGHGKLDFDSIACVSGTVLNKGVVGHRADILAVVRIVHSLSWFKC